MFLQHVQEFVNYFIFILWWVTLGVASSIGLGKCNWYRVFEDHGVLYSPVVNVEIGNGLRKVSGL